MSELERRGRDQTKTHAAILGDPRAVRIKLADRIANVEVSITARSPPLGMYRKEYRKFRSDLHRPGEHDPMWAWLDARLDPRKRRPE